MHGYGKLYFKNFNVAYEGHWENDQFNGQGRVYNIEPQPRSENFDYRDFENLGDQW